MNELGLVCIGVLLTLAFGAGIWWIEQDELRQRRGKADAILRRHGMRAERYIASIGEADIELRNALVEFERSGMIVLDSKGVVVGAICLSQQTKLFLTVSKTQTRRSEN